MRGQRRYRYRSLTEGVLLALGCPLGYWLLVHAAPEMRHSTTFLYLYLTLATPVMFGVFGWLMGAIQDRLHDQASTDSLTGLRNQEAFCEDLAAMNDLLKRKGIPVCLIMMDIDRFKHVNDTYNHLVGSKVLKDLGQIIRECTRQSDVLARFGGDEFVIALPFADQEQGEVVAERIRAAVASHAFRARDHSVSITISAGLAADQFREGLVPRDLIERADVALYEAKAKGRNRTVTASPQAS